MGKITQNPQKPQISGKNQTKPLKATNQWQKSKQNPHKNEK